jgi:hypothetical protein
MTFDSARLLTKATSRAKSDVANKLVGMFLHELSRKLSSEIGMRVSDASYAHAVVRTFGNNCAYCERSLEADRAAVEHLDGMNRFRVGLHIVGNVVMSCKRCNNQKRGDDSKVHLPLEGSGWESYLAHDGSRCEPGCKTCFYWEGIWPERETRVRKMFLARERISAFRAQFSKAILCGERARNNHQASVEALYRDGQDFASNRIKKSVSAALIDILAPR